MSNHVREKTSTLAAMYNRIIAAPGIVIIEC